MAKKTVNTIATQDRDTINAVEVFNEDAEYGSYTEALEKLVQRAVRVRLHRMTAGEFEEFVETLANKSAVGN